MLFMFYILRRFSRMCSSSFTFKVVTLGGVIPLKEVGLGSIVHVSSLKRLIYFEEVFIHVQFFAKD